MIDVKLFELRDSATCIPIMGVCVKADTLLRGFRDERERWLIRRGGWGPTQEGLYLMRVNPDEKVYAAALVGNSMLFRMSEYVSESRSYKVAFEHIAEHWHELESGDLIDVRVVLGEEELPAESDGPRMGGTE